jgi:hypothetical protein
MRHRIQSPTMPEGVIKDNSVLRMLENSLTDGAIYRYRHLNTGGGKTENMLATVKTFWTAVSIVFDEAWTLPPRKSRLTHGIGIISLGYVMDAIADTMLDMQDALDINDVMNELMILKDACPWTAGTWQFSDGTQRKWNDVQNISRDIRMVTNHLLDVYRTGSTATQPATSA